MFPRTKAAIVFFIISVFCGVQSLCAGRPSKRLKKQEAHEQLILAEREAEAARTKRLEHRCEKQEAKRLLDVKLERRRLQDECARERSERALSEITQGFVAIQNLEDLIPFKGQIVAYRTNSQYFTERYAYVERYDDRFEDGVSTADDVISPSLLLGHSPFYGYIQRIHGGEGGILLLPFIKSDIFGGMIGHSIDVKSPILKKHHLYMRRATLQEKSIMIMWGYDHIK